jgi:hypothetical protein
VLAPFVPAACLSLLCVTSLSLSQPPAQAEPGPVLKQFIVEGARVFTAEDVRWLLDLREGARLPGPPEHVADLLQNHYHREGYTAAEVIADYDASTGALRLTVDEGRIDDIEIVGVRPDVADRYRSELHVRPGDVYNPRIIRRDVQRVLADTNGAVRIGRPRRPSGVAEDDIQLIDRGGRRVLVIPLREESARFNLGVGTDAREDLYNPVDGFTPALDFEGAAFDSGARNYTLFTGFASYKFGPERPGYSLGMERNFGGAVRAYTGVEIHDISDSDDRWRITSAEQTLVSLAFKNTFRDYYRRRGLQVHGGVRAGGNHEFTVAWRRDRHEPLTNTTDYSFFRDDHQFRENLAVLPGDVRAIVLGYTYDSRALDAATIGATYRRHLMEDLFRGVTRRGFGWRFDWTGEIAGHGLGGDREYQRHIFNTRAYVPLAPRQSISARLLLGDSDGSLPAERRFALGGIGTVHGYRFKEAVGERMALVNLEYRFDLSGENRHDWPGGFSALVFYDAGRIARPLMESTSSWLNGVGVGLQIASIRIEVGFRAADIPSSRQVLVRLVPTF